MLMPYQQPTLMADKELMMITVFSFTLNVYRATAAAPTDDLHGRQICSDRKVFEFSEMCECASKGAAVVEVEAGLLLPRHTAPAWPGRDRSLF